MRCILIGASRYLENDLEPGWCTAGESRPSASSRSWVSMPVLGSFCLGHCVGWGVVSNQQDILASLTRFIYLLRPKEGPLLLLLDRHWLEDQFKSLTWHVMWSSDQRVIVNIVEPSKWSSINRCTNRWRNLFEQVALQLESFKGKIRARASSSVRQYRHLLVLVCHYTTRWVQYFPKTWSATDKQDSPLKNKC